MPQGMSKQSCILCFPREAGYCRVRAMVLDLWNRRIASPFQASRYQFLICDLIFFNHTVTIT